MPANIYNLIMIRFIVLFLFILTAQTLSASPMVHLSAFAAGSGPSQDGGVFRLLDGNNTPGQSNAVAFDLALEGAYEQMTLRCMLRVLAGGDGGALVFLNTAEYGRRGPAPFVKSWVEPNLAGTFAVGIDVHNPPDNEPFGPRGNYQGLPEREISLHWDGREIVKRMSAAEFRGSFSEVEIHVQHVIGGAEVTVSVAGDKVFDRYFLAGMLPYESRLAIGAGTGDDATTEFDVRDVLFTKSTPARPPRPSQHFELFNHITVSSSSSSHWQDVTLPPRNFAFGRIILTLEIHDAGPDWNVWDLNGYLYVVDPDGVKRDIAPFITSFRKPGHWKVDVTHFRPWLAGEVKLGIAIEPGIEKNKVYLISAALDFYHGAPDLEPYRVVPLWVGRATYGSADNHFRDFFAPQAVNIGMSTAAARLFITTTGHSKVGEFTPSRRTVVFAPEKGGDPAAEQRFESVLWKTDNYLNPNRPQSGTWKSSRAGWAPGDVVQPWWIDLTRYIIPGKAAEFRYEPEPYDFASLPEDERPAREEINRAVHLVRAYLILYRTPEDLMVSPPLKVLSVEADSNAAKGGILAGDYLQSYDNKRPDSIADLREFIRLAEEAGRETVVVEIFRGAAWLENKLGPGRMGVLLEEQ